MSLRRVLAVSNLHSAFSLQILAIRPCWDTMYSKIPGSRCPFMLNPFALRYSHLWLSPRCMSKCQKRKVAVARLWRRQDHKISIHRIILTIQKHTLLRLVPPLLA